MNEFHPFQLSQKFSKLEKIIILTLLAFIVLASLYLWRQNFLKNTTEVPSTGGTYIEGILSESQNTLNESATALTHIGLTRLGSDGTIQPSAAKSWQISEDGKTYTFKLENKFSSDEVAKYIRVQKGNWSNVQIQTPDSSTLNLTLNQPYGLFLASTMRPFLPYGPYRVKDQASKELTLIANPDALHQPYINKVIFRIYQTKDQLANALKSGKISGTGEEIASANNIRTYSAAYPHYNVAFFNTEKLTDKNLRSQIINGPALATPLTLNLLRPNTESAAKFTDQLVKTWSTRNIKVNVKIAPSVSLLTGQITTKQYDVLVYTFNSGYYDDLYLYWHSTELPPKGMNFSLYKNKAVDRLIEDARLTLDDQARRDKFSQAKALINADSVAVYQPKQPYTFQVNKKVKGIAIKSLVSPTDRFSFLQFWYIKTKRVKK